MDIAAGVYRIDGVRGANAYVVTTEEGLLVVDTGLAGNADKIVTFVRGLGHAPSDIRTIAITHADPDHVGSVARLTALTGAKVAIHADDAATLAGGPSAKSPKGALGVALSALLRLMRIEPVDADVVLHEGDSVSGFTVMHTPGHTARQHHAVPRRCRLLRGRLAQRRRGARPSAPQGACGRLRAGACVRRQS